MDTHTKRLQTTDVVPGASVRLRDALPHARALQFTFLILLSDFLQLLRLSLFIEIAQVLLLPTRVCIYIVIFCWYLPRVSLGKLLSVRLKNTSISCFPVSPQLCKVEATEVESGGQLTWKQPSSFDLVGVGSKD